jgi:hypothetical protein
MSNVNETVVRYLAAWNETEARRRRELVAKAWTDDGTYVDAAREGHGHDSLDAMIATAQGHFPGYRLHLASGIEAHHDCLRFSWAAGGTAEAPQHINSTDVVVVAEDGRNNAEDGLSTSTGASRKEGRDGQEKCFKVARRCGRRHPCRGRRRVGRRRASGD